MPEWLLDYFEEIGLEIMKKEGRNLAMPSCFSKAGPLSLPSLWITPPDPIFLLSENQFKPRLLYRPRVFLWLLHFFVKVLICPDCKKCGLEKNGALPPRRITDLEDNFYIITWSYYCRKGCGHYFAGWSPRLLASLPRQLQLAFPAVLSHRGGLSYNVVKLLRTSNQHKMGPSGVRSLLMELHTRRYNRILLQYLETVFSVVRNQEEADQARTGRSLDSFVTAGRVVADFGDFWDPNGYAGWVPSERYLTKMMMADVERDEDHANQHTACLPMDQISVDDSFKVRVQCFSSENT